MFSSFWKKLKNLGASVSNFWERFKYHWCFVFERINLQGSCCSYFEKKKKESWCLYCSFLKYLKESGVLFKRKNWNNVVVPCVFFLILKSSGKPWCLGFENIWKNVEVFNFFVRLFKRLFGYPKVFQRILWFLISFFSRMERYL